MRPIWGLPGQRTAYSFNSPLNSGRTIEQKKNFYNAVANSLHERLGLRPEDVFINVVEVPKENWSFGNGEAQYAS